MKIISSGQDLTLWRKINGWTQPQLASHLSVDIKTIQAFERSAFIPMVVTLEIMDLDRLLGP
jgi:transcriptional regulator with XRE-family HTH domain